MDLLEEFREQFAFLPAVYKDQPGRVKHCERAHAMLVGAHVT